MKTKFASLLIATTAVLFFAPLAEASLKNKSYHLKGFIYTSLFGIQNIDGANLTTTSSTFTLSGGGLNNTLNGSILNEQDFGTVAIANANVVIPGVGTVPFTGIQVSNQVFAFGSATGNFGDFPAFLFFFLSGPEK